MELLSDPARFSEQTRLYLAVREKEGRLYPDDILRYLPDNQHDRIWTWRRRSLLRLCAYLRRRYKKQPIRIADIGCGNGWMSNYLVRHLGSTCWGVDVNLEELQTAERVFSQPGLQFYFADITENVLPEHYFDIVLFAGSIQYFEDIPRLKESARRILRPGGQIHIIDSNFYPDNSKRETARAATADYYKAMGVPGLTRIFTIIFFQRSAVLT